MKRNLTEQQCRMIFDRHGFDDVPWSEAHSLLTKQVGHVPLAGDVAWGVWNTLLKREPNNEIVIRLGMAEQVWLEGGDPHPMMRLAMQAKIKEWMQHPWIVACKVQIAPDCCHACKLQKNRKMSLADALTNPPVPCVGCTQPRDDRVSPYPWCRCCLTAVIHIE